MWHVEKFKGQKTPVYNEAKEVADETPVIRRLVDSLLILLTLTSPLSPSLLLMMVHNLETTHGAFYTASICYNEMQLAKCNIVIGKSQFCAKFFYHSVCTVLQPFHVDIFVGFLQNHYLVQLRVCIKQEFELFSV